MTKDEIRISKYLSKILRHAPESVGLVLEAGGWVDIQELLAACKRHGTLITYEQLKNVVSGNDKQRFALDPVTRKIRANQGHSVDVDLQLAPAMPPGVLYHGTGAGSVDAIYKSGGLQKMKRHHVHLSADVETAVRVGGRHGKAVVFEVDAAGMVADGVVFYMSDNGVWLVDTVPAKYLTRREFPLVAALVDLADDMAALPDQAPPRSDLG